MLSVNTIARVVVNTVRSSASPADFNTGLLLIEDANYADARRLQAVDSSAVAVAQLTAWGFDAASSSIQNLVLTLAAEMPGLFGGEGNGNVTESLGRDSGLKLDLDLSAADKSLAQFMKKASQPVRLSADASAVVSAGQAAYNSIKSIFSTPITVKAEADTSAVTSAAGAGGSTVTMMSSGGRFSNPTRVEVAEDGGTEYIIPVRREGRAVPLLKQLLSELSPGARESVLAGAGAPASASVSGLGALSPSAGSFTQNNKNVSAPVTINVRANGSSPEAVGRSVYDAAERYLLRALSNS